MHRGTNPASFEGRISAPLMARDEQQNPFAGGNCTLQRAIDRVPSAIETVPVQVHHPVRIDPAGPEPPIPPAVERRMMDLLGGFGGQRRGARRRISLPLGFAEASAPGRRFDRTGASALSRDKGLIDAVTLPQSSASSADSLRTAHYPLGQ